MAAHGGEPTGRRFAPLLILLALVLLGYALRVYNLDAFSFWTDEGLTPARSGYPVAQILRNEIVIQGVVTKDTHPPLYYLIIHVTRQLFGLSDFAFRYPSVLFGVLLIPLLYQLGRRMGGQTLGLLVALLAAVNPLQVYYSQEARMYTLLALLVTAMSYVLWRALGEEAEEPDAKMRLARWLLLYGLLAGLAFYTHYTAAFLIAAQALFWGWLLWRRGMRRLILGALVVAALAAIPLLPYTVPRLLGGAEANYSYVSPLVMLQDVVRFFNLGLTVDFEQGFVRLLNGLALGLLALGAWGARPWRKRLFLIAWLLAVVLGLMLGSLLFKPMYQGVRHIMAGSPAFLLLVASGIWVVWTWLPPPVVARVGNPAGATTGRQEELTGWTAWRASRPAVNPFGIMLLALLLLGSTLALVNLYTDPTYAKDDFRAIVRFIETRAGARDVVLYNNAVLLPLHEHYRLRPDIAVTALPTYPQVATGQEPELAALAADYERIWFVTDPPADGRDDARLIHAWLDDQLLQVSNRIFPARTTIAEVIGYGTAADGRPPTAVSIEGLESPALRGVRVGGSQPLTLPTLWIDLFWEGEEPAGNVLLHFSLTGPDGLERFRYTHRLPGREESWSSSGSNRRSYDLPLPPGLPPGVYVLSLALDDGELLPIGEIELAATDTWPAAPEQLFADDLRAASRPRPMVVWPAGLALAAVEPWDDSVLPGNNLPLTLHWRAGPDGIDLTDLRYRLEVLGPDGDVLRTQEARPGAPWLGRVAGGALLREVTSLYFGPDTAPGRYRLRWTLLEGDASIGQATTAGRIVVKPWPLVTEAPPAAVVVDAGFGPAIRLYGYDLGPAADGQLPLTLYWQATAAPEGDYVVFVHLVDGATGEIVSQVDTIPVGGQRTTSGWRRGEVVTDAYQLSLPSGLPPGRYHVNVGLYNPDDGTRLPVDLDGVNQPDDQLRLTTLDLAGEAP
ncbi:glycosyltransferase family 39 protein [Promineifilum sp.]|uniref:glycosyltransferase family 39 protein n=1 Tax=Promineifilum sp. TaxID=2664178 RepID=UPI0035B10C08